MFIELVSGVRYPKITTVGFVLKRPFVDVLSSCRSFLLFFYLLFCGNLFNFFVSGILLFVLWETFCVNPPPATCELVSRAELQSSLSRVLLSP